MLKFRSFFPFVVLLIVPLVFISLPSSITEDIRIRISAWSGPVINISHHATEYTKRVISRFWKLWQALDENTSLKKQIQDLQLEKMQYHETELENSRLLDLLQFVEKEKWQSIPARVIGRDPNAWYKGILIDRGRIHGVMPGMAVVVGDGLVGKVMDAYEDWSNVLLLIDTRCKIGALIQKTREIGILQGDESTRCIINYLPIDAKFDIGDTVVTAGFGNFIPNGIMIGSVNRVYEHEFGLYRCAIVNINVDLSKLEEVLVIIRHGGKSNRKYTEDL
ncbi:MAG: rod shape-determining protein MreC [Chlamydiota bacterium]|nr:rod shape-determining protein MreC [Chlamydiota bacterium]